MNHRKKFSAEMQTIKNLSQNLIQIQQPIRILDALQWPEDIKTKFFKHKCKRLPEVDETTYQKKPLAYDPLHKYEELEDLELDIKNKLGDISGLGKCLQRMCREYKLVIRLLNNRGKPDFYKYAKALYGSSKDAFYAEGPTLLDLAKSLQKTIPALSNSLVSEKDEKRYSADEAQVILNKRLKKYFYHQEMKSKDIVQVSDQMVADAAAGAELIKLRSHASFSERDINLLEVHEGWVHLGTTFNGMLQPVCTFLSKGPPSSTITQEGLAVLMEVFTFRSFPARLQRLTNRIIGIHMAEEGADFLEVFNYFKSIGVDEEESFYLCMRIFRGSLPQANAGPFTKDLSYSKGFVLLFNFIRLAIKHNAIDQIPLLFIGKTILEDLPLLMDLLKEKMIEPPLFLPPQFKDLAALSSWMSFSLFMNEIDLSRMELDYKAILRI